MKNRFLLSICFLLCSISLLHAEQEPLPYLQNPTRDGITVIWHTEKPAYGWVEYGKTEKLGKKADLVIDGLRNANTTTHKVSLKNLVSGTTYYYAVCYKPILEFGAYKVDFGDVVRSETFSFKTFPKDTSHISCVIFNDLHDDRGQVFKPLCDALSKDSDYQFSIFNGDCFNDPKSRDDVLRCLEKYNKGVSAHSRPALYIRGNHEIRGAFARKLKPMFDFPGNEYYFAMTAGPVRFIFLDCGEDKPDSHWAYSGLNDFTGYREAQKEWLKKEIKTEEFQKAKYRVLVHHIPLMDRPGKSSPNESRKLWSPTLDSAPIDLAVCGHTHNYQFVPVGERNNSHPILIGGGPGVEKGTVIVLSADEKKLCVKVLKANGETIDNFEKIGNNELKATSIPEL